MRGTARISGLAVFGRGNKMLAAHAMSTCYLFGFSNNNHSDAPELCNCRQPQSSIASTMIATHSTGKRAVANWWQLPRRRQQQQQQQQAAIYLLALTACIIVVALNNGVRVSGAFVQVAYDGPTSAQYDHPSAQTQVNNGAAQKKQRQQQQQDIKLLYDEQTKSLGALVNRSLMSLESLAANRRDYQAQRDDSKVSGMRRLLVRQLTNLVMNHEPEKIAENMRGTRVSGEMVSESDLMEYMEPSNTSQGRIKSSEMVSDAAADGDHASIATLDNGKQQELNQRQSFSSALLAQEDPIDQSLATGSASEVDLAYQEAQTQRELEEQLAANNGVSGVGGGADDGQNTTCSPDYEDQVLYEAAGNLTAEQQQQLLAGADSSGLLNVNSSGEFGGGGGGSSNPISRSVQCIPPGSRMIEVITKVITPILFSIIIVVGLLGNIIVMLVILEDHKTERELTPTNLLILDLSLADLSFIIFCIPFTAWDYSVGHWVFGSAWCKVNQYLIVVCALSSIYTLVLMSIDRFMAIVYPIECISYRTSKNMLYAIYIKWFLILLMASPTIAMHGLLESPLGPEQYTCRFLADQFNPLHFQITFFITSYLFPLILIFCLYLSLLNKLWFGSKPHGHKESIKTLESKKKVTWLVAGIVVVFALCWCPIQVMLILMRLKSHKITATYVAIQVFSHTLGYMNSCVNPIVYAFASETFHNSFKRSSLGRFCYMCFCMDQHNQDHDRSTNTFRTINTATPSTLNNQIHRQSLNHISTSHHDGGKNGTLGTSNNISTTTLLMTPHKSNSENSRKIVTLPLEPRDRDLALISPIAVKSTSFNNSQQQEHQSKQAEDDTDACQSNQPTATSSSAMPAKQQLVAQVSVQSSGVNQVSHRCYQQEVIAP